MKHLFTDQMPNLLSLLIGGAKITSINLFEVNRLIKFSSGPGQVFIERETVEYYFYDIKVPSEPVGPANGQCNTQSPPRRSG